MTPEPEAIAVIQKMSRDEAQTELLNILQHLYSMVPDSVMEESGALGVVHYGLRPLHIRVMRLLSDARWPCTVCHGEEYLYDAEDIEHNCDHCENGLEPDA